MLRSLILDNCEVWCVTFMRSLCFKLEKISCYLNASELWYYSTLLSFFLRFLLSVVPFIHVFSRYQCQSIYYTEILMMYFSFQSLSIVELNSSSLVSLSLAGCRSMTFLRLSCPNLQNVNLDGCDHLQSAAFCPVSLLISSDVQYILLLLANLLADIRCNFVFSTWIEYDVAFLGKALASRK